MSFYPTKDLQKQQMKSSRIDDMLMPPKKRFPCFPATIIIYLHNNVGAEEHRAFGLWDAEFLYAEVRLTC